MADHDFVARRAQRRAAVPEALRDAGGLAAEGAVPRVAAATGAAEAHVYGVGSFFHLLADPTPEVRVCTGLSCQLAGSERRLKEARDAGEHVAECACLAACDQPVATLRGRTVNARSADGTETPAGVGTIGALDTDLAIDLGAANAVGDTAWNRAQILGADATMDEITRSGLQGRGGAGFPAGMKWAAVAAQPEARRTVVLNADEGEPGTFKDREVLLRRPDRVLEGLAIAAAAVGAAEVYCYVRGEFEAPVMPLRRAIAYAEAHGLYGGLSFHVHEGHGAYICGEETALIEALEGNRGMPRLKPPYPTEVGLWGRPTLVHNVETIACVPEIILRGADWFRALGRTGSGTKLYSVSGHVARPGVYELPLGVSLDELLDLCGGVVGTLKAFSPGGASSGFLPASERARPLDFASLQEVGSMLGSAGVVVLNDTVDMSWAALGALRFFRDESCGQCAPCRIGTQVLVQALERYRAGDDDALDRTAELAWEMDEGSICGLGQAAPLPLTSARRWFPQDFPR